MGGGSSEFVGGSDSFDGLEYIPVMRFYFKSEDNRRYVHKKNKYDSDILFEKSFNYEPEEDVKPYFEKGERRLIKNTYESISGALMLSTTCVDVICSSIWMAVVNVVK